MACTTNSAYCVVPANSLQSGRFWATQRVHGGALPPLTIASGSKQSFVDVSVPVSAQRISLLCQS